LSGLALEAAQANAERHGVAGRIVFLNGSWFEPLFTSPSEGEVDPLGSGEGAFDTHVTQERPPRPALRADLSPEGRGDDRLHLIVANPPYITSAVVETLAPEVRDFDPRLALDGGPDGLAPYRVIAAQSAAWLAPSGRVLVEIGFDQAAAISALFLEAGFEDVEVHRDLNGLDRVVSAHHL
jgi:release factor glutamine methyltransferase